MLQTIKKILSEFSGVATKLITNDMHLENDLYIEEHDLEDLLNEMEDQLGVEFEERDTELVYVSDLIALVKSSI